MLIKNNFGQRHYGITSYYNQYRFDKISNYITYSEYLKERFGSGFYMRSIRSNAIKALELRLKEVDDLIVKYQDNEYYIKEFNVVKANYEDRLNRINKRFIR